MSVVFPQLVGDPTPWLNPNRQHKTAFIAAPMPTFPIWQEHFASNAKTGTQNFSFISIFKFRDAWISDEILFAGYQNKLQIHIELKLEINFYLLQWFQKH